MLKALICNTATDLGNPGPDYTFGFGSLNALAADGAMENNQFATGQLANGNNNTSTINVPAGAQQVRILLCWTDYPAAPYAATALVNNLDLTVTDPGSLVHHPLILNPDPAHVGDVAVEGVDTLNNIEQVVINNPAGGNFTIVVNGTDVPQGPRELCHHLAGHPALHPTTVSLWERDLGSRKYREYPLECLRNGFQHFYH